MTKLLRIIALLLCMPLAGCPWPLAKPNPESSYATIDAVQKELATRAKSAIGNTNDFNIIVTQANFPIGTLVRPSSTIPVDYTGCLPQTTPNAYSTPSLFPTYELKRGIAFDMGLDNDLIKKIADFGVNFKDEGTASLTVKSAKIMTLSDDEITSLSKRPDCQKALSGRSVLLIRGYIVGQRTFTLKASNTSSIKGKIEKIASFNITPGSGDESVSITDDSEAQFLQVVSQITIEEISALTAGPTVSVLSVETPKSSSRPALVYIQRDRLDMTNQAQTVAQNLKSASYSLADSIEAIDTSKMPRQAQVRYFNVEDKEDAERALIEVRKVFPSATAVPIRGIPAPKGQLEVWLAKNNQ